MRRHAIAPRADWPARVEPLGFDWHTAEQGPYWDESACWSFSLREIEDDLEAPTAEIEQMALAFAGDAVRDEAVLKSLAIPEPFWPVIAESWNRGDRNLYGRFDFAWDGTGPAKLLEYNADTPTSLLESAVVQWVWLEEQLASGALPAGADQFNSIHERLIEALRQLRRGTPYRLHLAAMREQPEDRGTADYLKGCAETAGMATTALDMAEIGLTDTGRFIDGGNRPIDVLFKLYPWEWMMREAFGKAVAGSGTQFIEPPWKAVLSTKGLLPHLWKRAPGHPNLLPAFFDGDPAASALGAHVRKPLYSREGANVTVFGSGGAVEAADEGPYGAEGFILQEAARLARAPGGFAVLGSWVVASEPAGLCVREDNSLITTNLARFIPHYIEP